MCDNERTSYSAAEEAQHKRAMGKAKTIHKNIRRNDKQVTSAMDEHVWRLKGGRDAIFVLGARV